HLEGSDLNFIFTPILEGRNTYLPEKGQSLVIGLRPECISLSGESRVRGIVYSALPSGMETTVIVKIHNTHLTLVVFGGQDFPVDKEIGLDFTHDNYILFNERDGKNIASGSVRITQVRTAVE
ncbi:MAG: TOBE domain-containing protein, partial [Desulforhopalus sp.]